MSLEVMKQALEALEQVKPLYTKQHAISALRQAIEQAEKQEPVAWLDPEGEDDYNVITASWKRKMQAGPMRLEREHAKKHTVPVYTTPPAAQRQWVDMPELELLGAYEEEQQGRWGDHVRGLLNVQAKLKELNHVN